MTPTLVRLVLETEFLQGAGKVFVPQLNGYDIFMALLIDVQDCGKNRSHRAAFGAISLPPLNQPIPYSFRWVRLTSAYGWGLTQNAVRTARFY